MNEIKAFFLHYGRAVERIREAEQGIRKTEQIVDSIKATGDGMPRGSGISDRTGALAVQLADAKARREDLIADAWAKREAIEAVINEIDNTIHARLLFDRYVALMTWQQVADDLPADETYTRGRLHGSALESAKKIIEFRKMQQNAT